MPSNLVKDSHARHFMAPGRRTWSPHGTRLKKAMVKQFVPLLHAALSKPSG